MAGEVGAAPAGRVTERMACGRAVEAAVASVGPVAGFEAGRPERSAVALGLTLIAAFCGGLMLWWHPKQPFPEISRLWGGVFVALALFTLLADNGPRPMTLVFHAGLVTIVATIALVVGLIQMGRNERDVLVAPFAGLLVSAGLIGLLADGWSEMTGVEQGMAGLLAAIVLMGAMYIVFKGLFVGDLKHAWSQAALRQLSRGLIDGPRGAVTFFERAWEDRVSPLNAMSYSANARILQRMGRADEAAEWEARLEDQGGWSIVDDGWLATVDQLLDQLPGASTTSPMITDDE